VFVRYEITRYETWRRPPPHLPSSYVPGGPAQDWLSSTVERFQLKCSLCYTGNLNASVIAQQYSSVTFMSCFQSGTEKNWRAFLKKKLVFPFLSFFFSNFASQKLSKFINCVSRGVPEEYSNSQQSLPWVSRVELHVPANNIKRWVCYRNATMCSLYTVVEPSNDARCCQQYKFILCY